MERRKAPQRPPNESILSTSSANRAQYITVNMHLFIVYCLFRILNKMKIPHWRKNNFTKMEQPFKRKHETLIDISTQMIYSCQSLSHDVVNEGILKCFCFFGLKSLLSHCNKHVITPEVLRRLNKCKS